MIFTLRYSTTSTLNQNGDNCIINLLLFNDLLENFKATFPRSGDTKREIKNMNNSRNDKAVY